MALVEIISLSRCREGAGVFVTHGDRELAVFFLREPDRVYVIDNACPHSSGNLSGGEVTDDIVECPLHNWRFDLCTGVCTRSDLARVGRYPAVIRDGAVWADLEAGCSADGVVGDHGG